MSAYALHVAGDCWPDTCPVCAHEDATTDETENEDDE